MLPILALALAFPQIGSADPPTFTSTQTDIVLEATNRDGAYVEFALPTAIDDNGSPDVSCNPAPGAFFDVGATAVTCVATDWLTGERSSMSFSVRVLNRAQERSSRGQVTALLYYRRLTDPYGFITYKNVRVTIIRNGAVALNATVPPYPGGYGTVNPAGYGQQRSIFTRDLDGDQEPEIVLNLYWGGAHCCFWSYVYRYAQQGYRRSSHFWGDTSYRFGDLDKDGTPEFVSADDRFAYKFTDFATSRFPIQIWSYAEAGRLLDITELFPHSIRADAARHWRSYRSLRRAPYPVRGALAAWVADECLLHREAIAFRRMRQLEAAGELSRADGPDSAGVYLWKLRRFLVRTEYCQ